MSTKLLTFGYIHAGKYQISLLVWFRPVPINLEGKNYKVILWAYWTGIMKKVLLWSTVLRKDLFMFKKLWCYLSEGKEAYPIEQLLRRMEFPSLQHIECAVKESPISIFLELDALEKLIFVLCGWYARSLKQMSKQKVNVTAKAVMDESGLAGIVTRRTFCRRLNKLGFGFFQARKKGLLSDHDKTKCSWTPSVYNIQWPFTNKQSSKKRTRKCQSRVSLHSCIISWSQPHG